MAYYCALGHIRGTTAPRRVPLLAKANALWLKQVSHSGRPFSVHPKDSLYTHPNVGWRGIDLSPRIQFNRSDRDGTVRPGDLGVVLLPQSRRPAPLEVRVKFHHDRNILGLNVLATQVGGPSDHRASIPCRPTLLLAVAAAAAATTAQRGHGFEKLLHG